MTALLPSHTLRSRVELINERLEGKYTMQADTTKGAGDVFDSEGEYLFTVPAWAMEDVDTAALVTLAMGDAYACGWTDRDNQGVL